MEHIILPKQKVSIWQILFYVSMASLTLWLILKLTGVIQTPDWLEYGFPAASLIISIFSFYQNLTENIKLLSVGFATLTVKVDHLESDMHVVKQDFGVLKHDVSSLKTDVSLIKKKIKM